MKRIEECGRTLIDSFSEQCRYYEKLLALTKKISGKIAMSRGDLSFLVEAMEEKNLLLEKIEALKESHYDDTLFWKSHRDRADEELLRRMDLVLNDVEQVITAFLKSEKQLQKQIEFYSKGAFRG
ncbi:MAG: hypothetical protein ACQEQV_02255 [Fibrobacterota bacterium]